MQRRTRGKRLSGKQVKQVSRLINKNKRLKQKWLSVDNQVPSTGSLAEISDVPQGNGYNQRDSEKILARSIQLSLSLNSTAGGFETSNVRIMIVRSKKGPLALSDLPGVFVEPNLDNLQVYFDKHYQINENNSMPVLIDYYKSFSNGKIPHMVIGYINANNAAINNPVYLYYINEPVGGGGPDGPSLEGYHIIKFFDAN